MTGIKGIYFNKQYQKYHVRVYRKGKNHHIGSFTALADATAALKRAKADLGCPASAHCYRRDLKSPFNFCAFVHK